MVVRYNTNCTDEVYNVRSVDTNLGGIVCYRQVSPVNGLCELFWFACTLVVAFKREALPVGELGAYGCRCAMPPMPTFLFLE